MATSIAYTVVYIASISCLGHHSQTKNFFFFAELDMVGAIEMTVVTELMMIAKNPQQNMAHEDTMSFSTDLTKPCCTLQVCAKCSDAKIKCRAQI